MPKNQYDLLIVGAGVSGSALLYLCTKYTDIKRIAVIEKYAAPARVNSLSSNNSQTLHCGDIETNYTLDKALKVQRAASMLRNYAVAQPDAHHITRRAKMEISEPPKARATNACKASLVSTPIAVRMA